MTRFRIVLAALALLFAASAFAAEKARPNILFIYADDQPYRTLSCYPETPDWVRTPQIDKLAEQGVRFQRAYLGSWCMPSRATILTGRLPFGVESMRMVGDYPGSEYDPQQCPFLPAQFRQQGYQTAQIGKWHTGTDTGFGRDWDYQIVWNRPKHPKNAGHYYKDQLLAFNGEEKTVDGYSTDNYTDWACDYIGGKNRDPQKPWYLWLCYGAVHGPTTPAPRHKGTLSGHQAPVPADIFGPWPDKPSYLKQTAQWHPGPGGQPVMGQSTKGKNNFDVDKPGMTLDARVQQVNECMLAVDEGVGRVMTALRESGQLENTLVIYTADQGFAFGEHGFNHKLAPYDANIASPLIVMQPGTLPEGKVCKQPVNSADIAATLCETAGIKVPWKLHGRDITPLLREPETAKWDSPTLMCHLTHFYGSETNTIPTDKHDLEQNGVPWWVLIRDGRYKYIRTLVANEPEELYDLDADPEELQNLAGKPEQRERLEQLRAKMIDELRRTEAGFVDTMPKVKEVGG